MKKYILIALLGCSIQMHAQTAAKDTAFQRMMTLEKEYNPTIDKASKINTLPEVKEPQAPQAKIEFSNYSTPANIKPEASQVAAAQYFKDLGSSKKRGYLRAGVSTFVDIDGDAGIQILNSTTNDLSIWATHRSSSGKIKSLQTDEKLKLKLNDNTGAFRYSHNFKSSKLFADAKYTYSEFNYYGGGFPINGAMPDYLLFHSNQANNIFDANLGFLSKNTLPLNIFLGVNFTYFDQKESVLQNENEFKGENTLKVNFDFYKDFDGNKTVGLAGYSRTNFYPVQTITYKDYSDLAFNPYFKIEGDNWRMRLGAFAHLLFNQTKTFFLTPDVELSFRPYESGLLYMTAKGEVADNGNSKIFNENRYVLLFDRVSDSYTGIDGTAGFRTTFSGVFDIDFYAGYKITTQEHFYRPLILSSSDGDYACDFHYVDYYDTKVLKFGTNMKYQYGKVFDLSLKAAYYKWEVDETGAEAWNKPTFESDITAGFQFQTIPLRIDLAYHLETERKSFDGQVVNMENINDISLTETCAINNTFSIFARIDNLLNQKYDIWYGYPAEGRRFMGGLSIKF